MPRDKKTGRDKRTVASTEPPKVVTPRFSRAVLLEFDEVPWLDFWGTTEEEALSSATRELNRLFPQGIEVIE